MRGKKPHKHKRCSSWVLLTLSSITNSDGMKHNSGHSEVGKTVSLALGSLLSEGKIVWSKSAKQLRHPGVYSCRLWAALVVQCKGPCHTLLPRGWQSSVNSYCHIHYDKGRQRERKNAKWVALVVLGDSLWHLVKSPLQSLYPWSNTKLP